ncbi:Probable protein phosphatase 2C 14 (AtPP2C14) (Protein phosphatase AP2C4) [Durusdinium trenchii]|uniref:Probable protein phosphatase 2C 14 (AtPP2C14) (Protein phosphatase AP2C4) n=1 Tax=Durusdinium trenchii TaxID=1381693 RepID=A0ABP0PIS6_9DINO
MSVLLRNLSDFEAEQSRSRSPERVPPTQFEDYEPAGDGGKPQSVYKKTGKWKFHPETGLYFHLKSQVYYTPKESDHRFFRRIDDDEDPLVRKMKQSEEMRKAISKTEFMKFEVDGSSVQAAERELGVAEDQLWESAADPTGPAPMVGPPEPPPKEEKKEEAARLDLRLEGRVNKWDSEKGFGFIMPAGKEEGGDMGKGLFVHRKFIVGSTPSNPINLKEGVKVSFKQGTQDSKPCALEVLMLGADGKPLPIHAGAQTLEEKKKSYHVSAESLGLRVHCESWPGLKKTLQDRYVLDEPLEELGVYFAVLDGHGGTQVADMAKEKLQKNVLQQMRQRQVQPASRDEKIKMAIKEAFLQTDKEILGLAERKKFELVGSTCAGKLSEKSVEQLKCGLRLAILRGNTALVSSMPGTGKLGTALRLVVSNLGDSRAVLCRAGTAVPVSEDHKPTRMDEKKRIERVGGLVLQVRGAWRVATSTNPNSMNKAARREYQGLAMTRSFGDLWGCPFVQLFSFFRRLGFQSWCAQKSRVHATEAGHVVCGAWLLMLWSPPSVEGKSGREGHTER